MTDKNESYPFGISMRNYFSSYYLYSSIYHRNEVRKIEDNHSGESRFDWRHRAFVLSSVISAVLFSEAFINEILKDIKDDELAGYPPIPENGKDYLKNMWESIEQAPPANKFQTVLFVFGKPIFKIGTQPYQDYKLLIELRNFLTHYKPKTIGMGNEHELAKKLERKFEENILMAGSGNSYFPDKALGFGCTAWAIESAKRICDDFCKRINYVPNYQQIKLEELADSSSI